MAKKKKVKLFSALAVIEGEKREADFLKYLKSIYLDEKKIKFKEDPLHGGNPNALIAKAIKQLHFGYNRIFIWLDEDLDINDESRNSLFKAWKIDEPKKNEFFSCPINQLQQTYNTPQHRNPILIVSQPVSVESLILKTLGKNIPATCEQLNPVNRSKQLRDLKSCLNQAFGGLDEYEYYTLNLKKDDLEAKRSEIEGLNMLISMLLTSDTP